MGLDNPIHLMFLLVVLLLVFGAKRLPELGHSLGTGLRGFKEAIGGDGVQSTFSAMTQDHSQPQASVASTQSQASNAQPQATVVGTQTPAATADTQPSASTVDTQPAVQLAGVPASAPTVASEPNDRAA
jgi:sec-independent protein translocase protein TatA